MDLYRKFIEEKQKEFDNFKGIGFAFSNKQFEEMLIKLNASPKDLYDLGAGTFILKDRYQAFIDLSNNYYKKLNELMKDYNFALSGFTYELANHEYNIIIKCVFVIFYIVYVLKYIFKFKYIFIFNHHS